MSRGLFYRSPCYVSEPWSCKDPCCLWGALGFNQIYPVFRRWTKVLWVWNDMGWVIKDRIFVFGWTNPFIKTWSGQSVGIIFGPNFVFILLADHCMIIFLNIICQLIFLSWITFYNFILGKMTLVFLTIDGKKSHQSTILIKYRKIVVSNS